jgi:hypothetical protein
MGSDGSQHVSETVTVNGSDGSAFSMTSTHTTDAQGHVTETQDVQYRDSSGRTQSESSCSGYGCGDSSGSGSSASDGSAGGGSSNDSDDTSGDDSDSDDGSTASSDDDEDDSGDEGGDSGDDGSEESESSAGMPSDPNAGTGGGGQRAVTPGSVRGPGFGTIDRAPDAATGRSTRTPRPPGSGTVDPAPDTAQGGSGGAPGRVATGRPPGTVDPAPDRERAARGTTALRVRPNPAADSATPGSAGGATVPVTPGAGGGGLVPGLAGAGPSMGGGTVGPGPQEWTCRRRLVEGRQGSLQCYCPVPSNPATGAFIQPCVPYPERAESAAEPAPSSEGPTTPFTGGEEKIDCRSYSDTQWHSMYPDVDPTSNPCRVMGF